MATQQPATFKSTQILYWAMFLGQFLMGVVLFYVVGAADQIPSSPFDLIIPAAPILGFAASFFMGQQRKSTIPDQNAPMLEKLEHYRTSNIIKYALAEGGNLICLVLTFIMANETYFIWYGLGLAGFVLLRPNKEQFKTDYGIGHGEEFE